MADLSGLVSHPDAGSQDVSIAFTQRLLDAGIDPSVGDAYDNALAQSTIGSFKTEQINRNGPWRHVNAVEVATFEWVDFFNAVRPHEHLDDLTPEEAEKLHHDHVTALPAAGLNTTPSLRTPREVAVAPSATRQPRPRGRARIASASGRGRNTHHLREVAPA